MVTSSPPFLQRLADRFRRGSSVSTVTPKRNWMQMMQENLPTTLPHEDALVSGEFDQDMARAVITVSARLLGMDAAHLSSSPGLLRLVARNMQWFHHTPDMFKLAGLVVAKKLNSLMLPSCASTSSTQSHDEVAEAPAPLADVIAVAEEPLETSVQEVSTDADVPTTSNGSVPSILDTPMTEAEGDKEWVDIVTELPKKRRRSRRKNESPPMEEALFMDELGPQEQTPLESQEQKES